MEILAISVGIGLVVALLCTELFGIASSGMIVPGYMALFLFVHFATPRSGGAPAASGGRRRRPCRVRFASWLVHARR